MKYQINHLVTQSKEQAIAQLAAMLRENKETFQDFMREQFNNDNERVLEVLMKGGKPATKRFEDMFSAYCVSVAQDILAEEGMDGCFIM